MKRKVTQSFLDWKASSRKALLVTGARQIGKSYSIREFGKANYGSYLELNLYENAEARESLAEARNVTDFLNRLVLFSEKELIRDDTLVFIDEIQECPDIMTMAKFLVQDGRYSYVFSGSMLGTEFKGVRSFPVGYVEELTMRPMDFEEFCWAIGVNVQVLDRVRDCYADCAPVDHYIHEALDRNFRMYVVVGGMPEVVQAFVDEGNSLAGVRSRQSDLVTQYEHDIAKYAGSRALHVKAVFDQIPLQLEEKSTRYVVGDTAQGARWQTYEQDFLWITNAGVALKVDLAAEAKAPLRRTVQPSKFKLYQSDTGMLVSRYTQGMARAIYLDRKDPNFGGVYENVIAQELVALGARPRYYATVAEGEVDFVVEDPDGRILPIEVKSGSRYHSHAALSRFMATDAYKLRKAIVFSHANTEMTERIDYLPFYMTFCLADRLQERPADFIMTPAVV